MKKFFLHVKRRVLEKFRRFSIEVNNFNLRIYILEKIQSILKILIDGKNGPWQLPLEDPSEEKSDSIKKVNRIFTTEPNGEKMTDREKLMKIEEALHKMRDNYRAIKANKSGALQMYTNKDVGDLVCKDLEKLFKYMEELEGL